MNIKDQAIALASHAMARIRLRRGATAFIAKTIGRRHQSLEKWKTVPFEHVFVVAKTLNTSPEFLRPDVFIDDPLRAERTARYVLDHANDPFPERRAKVVKLKKRRRVTEAHRAIWLGSITNDAAAAAVGAELGHPISRCTLYRRFGPSGRQSNFKRRTPRSEGLNQKN